jgi:hypothetical protein
MAQLIFSNGKFFLGEFDISGDLNSIVLNYGVNAQDDTAFGDDTISNKGGLLTVGFGIGGFVNDDPDSKIFSSMGVADTPVTIAAEGADDGEKSWIVPAMFADYAPGGAVGDMHSFDANGQGKALVEATVLGNATYGTTTTGTGRQLGAVLATQTLYAALHVITAGTGSPTLDVTIESDDNAGFTSAVQRIAFTQATAATSEIQTLDGAITDDYFRAVFTIGGSSPSFLAIVSVGIKTNL